MSTSGQVTSVLEQSGNEPHTCPLQDFQSAISSIEEATQPVIAAISGLCLGLGIDIASACDIRLVSDQANMGILVSRHCRSKGLTDLLMRLN